MISPVPSKTLVQSSGDIVINYIVANYHTGCNTVIYVDVAYTYQG